MSDQEAFGPDIQAINELARSVVLIPPELAPDTLREAVRRRGAALQTFASSAPDEASIEQQLAEVDVERIIYLVGTAQVALEMIAAAIVEIGATAQSIAEVVRWMDVRPVSLQPTQPHLGIDIAYIVAFRSLTADQRWLLHTLAIWAPPPTTIGFEHALVVGRSSGQLAGVGITPADLDRLASLGFITPLATPSPTGRRFDIDPYVRAIAGQGLGTWPIPDKSAGLSGDIIVANALINWAVAFAEVIGGPDMVETTDAGEAEDEELAAVDDEDAETTQLTPDPQMASLTAEEAWAALEPDAEHMLHAAVLARVLGSSEQLFSICALLALRLRTLTEPGARRFRQQILEEGLIAARNNTAQREIMLLATQLTDVALDAHDLERAAAFSQEALNAAIATKELRAIAFCARRLAAITIRQQDAKRAIIVARQAVAVARASGDHAALRESIALLDAATRLADPH